MKIILLFFIICGSFFALPAQTAKLMLHGRVVNNGKTVGEVQVDIISNQVDTIRSFETARNGAYKVNLTLGAVYTIEFSKEGYVMKAIGVIDKVPEEAAINGRYFYQLDVELFKQGTSLVDETILPPAAKIYLEDPMKGFTYDKQYVKWFQDEFDAFQSKE